MCAQNTQSTAANNVKAPVQNAGKTSVAGLLKTNSSSAIIVANNNATATANANSAANAKKVKNATNVKQQKSASNADDGTTHSYKKPDDEFGAWCHKALSAHVDVIDGKWATRKYVQFITSAKYVERPSTDGPWISFQPG